MFSTIMIPGSTAMKKALIPILLFALFCPASLLPSTQDHSKIQTEKPLVVGIVHDPPYLIKNKSGEWTGLNMDLWRMIAQDLKVDYVFKEMPFPELLKALKTKEIDISIESFFMLAERIKDIEFSVPLGSTRLAVATLPGRLDHPWLAAVKLFFSWGTLKVIGFLFMVLCILGFCFWLVERRSNPEHFGEGVVRGIVAGIYWVGSTLASGVCIGVILKSLPARILGLIWMLSCAVALSALIASLTTSLALSRLMAQTVDENALRHMRLGGIEASAESIVLKDLGGRYVLYKTEAEAFRALLKNEIDGYLYDEVTLHYYKDNDYKNRISIDPTGLRRYAVAFGLPKDSPWRVQINASLLSFTEKQDWILLLNRYGLGQNFEEVSAFPGNGRR
jgi:polar amino acid transport system substrate-binding protein